MRGVTFAMLVLVASGCSKRDSAPPGVQVTQADPNTVTNPTPEAIEPAPPKSLIRLDFVKLWDEAGPKRLTLEEQQQLHHGRVVYADHPDECFAPQIVGSGLANPVTIIARLRVQSDVVKQVRRAAEDPPSIKPMWGLLASGEFRGRRTTVIAVVDAPAEGRERFRQLVEQGVTPIVTSTTGVVVSVAPLAGLPSGARIVYSLPDRTGTITLALMSGPELKMLDTLIPPDDIVGRSLLGGRSEGVNLLIAIVEER